MLNIDIPALEQAIDKLTTTLKGGIFSIDIWDTASGLSLAGTQAQPGGVALLNDIISDIGSKLRSADWPGIGRFITIDMADDQLILIVRFADDALRGAALIDLSRTNLGIVLNVALPQLVADVEGAIRD